MKHYSQNEFEYLRDTQTLILSSNTFLKRVQSKEKPLRQHLLTKLSSSLLLMIIFSIFLSFTCSNSFAQEENLEKAIDLYEDAEDILEDALEIGEDVVELNQDEIERLVSGVCNATENERASVIKSLSTQLRDKIGKEWQKFDYNFEQYIEVVNEAEALFKKVFNNPNSNEDQKDDAEEYLEEIEDLNSKAAKREKLISNVISWAGRGEHPIGNYLREQGIRAHEIYQSSSSKCDVAEVVLNANNRCDCIKI